MQGQYALRVPCAMRFQRQSISTRLIPCAGSSSYPEHTTKKRKILRSSTSTVGRTLIHTNCPYSLTPSCSSGRAAIDQIFRVIREQSQPSFDENFNFISYYNWTGSRGALSPRVNNRGNNEPRGYTGLVGTSHRPSDDLTVFGAPIPLYCQADPELKKCSFLDPCKRHAQC